MNTEPSIWRRLALLPVLLVPLMPAVGRLLKPVSPAVMADVTLAVAGLLLLTIIVVGIVTWRRERSNHA